MDHEKCKQVVKCYANIKYPSIRYKSTTNIGVLLEVGRVPLTLYARKLAIKNWARIRKNKANSLIIESYKESLKEKLPWVIHIKKLLEENGMLTFFINTY